MAARKKPANAATSQKAKASAASKAARAARRPARRVKPTRIAFEALSIEGGLLSPEWLARIAQLGAAHQTEADYAVPKGLVLRDEIGRYWRIAQAHWKEFEAGRIAAGADRQVVADRFVLALLREAFGFRSLAPAEPVVIGDRAYPVRHRALDGRVPVVVAPAATGVDTLSPAFGEGGRRRSAFGLVQEALNADEQALWGIASDGVTFRVLRDNASLTRPAWLEADLERIFREEKYADFAALWLLAHESRFGAPGVAAAECPLEAWRTVGREEGTRAREHLREGVEDALLALGQGFLVHSENTALRDALGAGTLTPDGYFQQLLRLVYRLIFLLTAEERGVLHPDGSDAAVRIRYEEGYGLRRLRDRAVRRSAHDRFSDLWEGLHIVLRGVARGEPRLALPALGGLFAEDQCPDLDGVKLENRALLTALFRLSWLREDSGLSRVNWRDMGPEELGSVYESLLELVPRIPEDGRGFMFAEGAETKGNARKTTGSYYTPESLVQVLLDSALEPVVQQTVAGKSSEDAANALLSLSVVDPACGSGHFLLSAARRLAGHVARIQANGTPTNAQYRHALRQVVSRCLFGVDLNPMAVELCRVSLWMEAVEPGRPLSFLDSHVQVGNALLGATPELMANGIPDAAFEPTEGDDRRTASLLKKRNKAAAEGQRGLDLFARRGEEEAAEVVTAVRAIDEAPDVDLAEVAGKEASWEELQASAAYRHQKLVADAWCAAFVWPKPPIPEHRPGERTDPSPAVVTAAPTDDLWRQLRDGQGTPPKVMVETVEQLARQYRFFHWQLQFPQVFARGGFDVVLGNPPWDMNEVKDNEFFASSFPDLLAVKTAKDKAKVLARIAEENPSLMKRYAAYVREIEGQRHFFSGAGRFPLAAVGRLNLYRLFVELGAGVCSRVGRLGLVIPSGFVSDSFSQQHFASLNETGRLLVFFDFENAEGLFPSVHRSFRFALMVVGGAHAPGRATDFVFYARRVSDLERRERHVPMTAADIALVNPLTRTAPLFKTERDRLIAAAMYRAGIILDSKGAGSWDVSQVLMFMVNAEMNEHRAADELQTSHRLAGNTYTDDRGRWLPLYEGKMVAMYDHRAAGVRFDASNRVRRNQPDPFGDADHDDPSRVPLPMFWVPEPLVRERTEEPKSYLLCVKDVTASTNERTCIAAIVPEVGLTDSVPWLRTPVRGVAVAALLGNLNSIPLDYAARQKVAGLHLRGHYLAQFPLLPPDRFESPTKWDKRTVLEGWVLKRVLELSYTSWDLEPFAKDVGYDGPPFRWNTERRFLLRAELDAAFFHLYGISRDDADYILETFPIVRKNDEKAHGEYRTKRVILEIYDELAEAIRTGRPYQTRLDPPPADPRVAHPPRKGRA